ncbi:MAG: DNA gyrase/topoisomerase IV subunit A, partial [Duncaniella sp.]|nr:DNA gyrase/topoisomerase IV subunit A [Duncaniella sp.]
FSPEVVWTAVLNDADQGYPYIKRFTFESSAKPQRFLGENEKSTLILLTDTRHPRIEVTFGGDDASRPAIEINAGEFIAVKSFKAKGKRLTTFTVESVVELAPLVADEEEADGEPNESPEVEEVEVADVGESELSDDEVRDEITGQQRLF